MIKYCPSCGKPNLNDVALFTSCGYNLKQSNQISTKTYQSSTPSTWYYTNYNRLSGHLSPTHRNL